MIARIKGKAQRRNRVLVLSLHYKPEPNFITADVAEALAAGDAKVTVVTVHPNYPTGRFYPGTKPWSISRSVEKGVTIWRLPYYTDHSLSPIKRALSYLSFAVMAGLFAPLVAGKPDTVWIYHGPFMTAIAGLFFKWAYGSRVIYTCADLWPESFVASDVRLPGAVLNLLYRYSRWINRRADLLICATRGTVERYRRDGTPPQRLEYVPVWVEGVGDVVPDRVSGRPGTPNIVYAGNIGAAQPLESLIRAASILHRDGVKLTVDIYGTGNREDDLHELADAEGAGNVRFHGRVAPRKAFEVSTRATAQIVLLRPSPMFRMTLPSKLSFCFAAASPLLYGLEGESARIAAETGGGIPFEAENPESLAAAIRKLFALTPSERDEMRRNLRAFYEERFARETLIRRYVRLFNRKWEPDTRRLPPGTTSVK